MDLEPLQGHLSELRLNDFHQPICLTNPTELMLELWEEQPLCQHIHIFVQIFIRKQPPQSLCTSEFLFIYLISGNLAIIYPQFS